VDLRPDPIVLLHGQPGAGRDWQRVIAAIGERAHTLAPDRPGWHGAGTARDLDGNARAVIELLDNHGIARAVIVGHSFGGAVACWLAVAWPERVSALVLAAPAANVASLYPVDRWLATPLAGSVAAAGILAAAGATLGLGRARRRLAGALALDEPYLNDAGRLLRSRWAWRSFATEQRALVRDLPVLESKLATISAPARIVIGSEDRIVPRASARLLARQLPAAELSVLPGAGHLLPRHQPQQLAEIILAHAGGTGEPSTGA
jgi:pimeloyl-ACP methyl ester carboxylesterase